MTTEILTTESFDNFINKNDKAVVKFSTSWCNPCKLIKPMIASLANDIKSVAFAELDCEVCQEIAERYKIATVPTLIFFKDGVVSNTVYGGNKNNIVNAVNLLNDSK